MQNKTKTKKKGRQKEKKRKPNQSKIKKSFCHQALAWNTAFNYNDVNFIICIKNLDSLIKWNCLC